MGFVMCMGGLVGLLVWIGGGESSVGREARATRGLVMDMQDKQFMVSVSPTFASPRPWIGKKAA